MPIEALEMIRHNNEKYPKGSILSLADNEEARLIKLKAAKPVITAEKVQIPAPAPALKTIDDDLFNELKDALEENYNRADLAREAKKAGVIFETDALKNDIIEAVILQGKADELLEDEEDDEQDQSPEG
ncbi:hypothetical protein [Viridibacillus arvi]|uniref:hypothetical protein n=1 Tax=Viridibacillus arvi TaxID=263475 RepID=UPI0034CDF5F4